MKIICAGYGKTGTKSQDRNNRTGKLTWHRQSCHFFILSNFHCPGIGKTGTSSITKALRHLGFKVFDFEEQTFDSLCSQTSCQEPQICLTSRPTKSSLTTQMVRKTLPPVKEMFNPLTPGALSKKCVVWTFSWFLGWISAKLVLIWSKMGLQLSSLPFLPQASRFTTLWLGHAQKSRKWPTPLGFSIFGIFFRFYFFSFSFLFAPVIDLLLGLLPVKILLRKRDRDGQFLTWISQV